MDSRFSHAAWARDLGGISLPLLADFHPRGRVADAYGLFLPQDGTADRATVLLDADGVVRFVESVGPDGERDISALVARCEALAADFTGSTQAFGRAAGLPVGAELFVKDRCQYSRWATAARTNLHLDEALPTRNVSTDRAARDALVRRGGKDQAPALVLADRVLYESADIVRFLADRTTTL